MIVFILVLALILAVIAVVFALQNPAIVTAVFFSLSMKGSLALFVLGGVGLGILIGVLAMLPWALRSVMRVSQHRRQISNLQKSLDAQGPKVPDAAPSDIEEDPENK